MKVNMRSTVALTLVALAFVPAIAAHNTSPKEVHVTEVDTFTVDCTDEASRPAFSVETFFSTLSQFTLTEIARVTVPFPTKAVEHHTSAVIDYSPSEEQPVASATSTCDEEQPVVTPSASTSTEEQSVPSASSTSVEQPIVTPSFSTLTEEQPISSATSTFVEEQPVVSSTASASSTQEQSTIGFVPTHNVSTSVILFTSSADAHSEVPTKPAPVTSVKQVATTESIVPPVATTETPLINPIRPSFTPSDTPDLSYTTKTMTKSHTAVVTVILNPTHTLPASEVSEVSEASAESCLSTTYVTVYSPPASIIPVATVPSGVPAVFQNTTIVATGVPHPNTNNTTVQTPPIHGAAPTLSATPGLLLAFCGLICYLI